MGQVRVVGYRVRFNTEASWYRYKNIYVQELNSVGSLILTNAAAAMKGVDNNVQMGLTTSS